jgi:hypothetical protein
MLVPSDFNHDGTVAAADYVVGLKGIDTTYLQNDHDIWRVHFSQTASTGSGASAKAVSSEPATLVLLIAGIPMSFSRQSWLSA